MTDRKTRETLSSGDRGVTPEPLPEVVTHGEPSRLRPAEERAADDVFDFATFAASRRSWLGFDPGPIDRDLLRQLVATASTAPSEFNFQPWRFVVVEHSAYHRLRGAVLPQNHPKLADAAVIVAVFGDPTVIDTDERARSFFELGIATRRDFAIRNASLAAMQFLLAAHAQGLGARPMIGFEPAGLAGALGAPPDWVPVMIIVVGHRGIPAHPAVSSRRSVDEIITFIAEP